jgi:hypothetical protein
MRLIVGILYLVFVISGFGSFGQSAGRTYGDIAPSDFVRTENEESAKSQGAIVLFDVGESYFVQSGYSFNLVLERHIRIKILNNVGLKWADEQIPYYASGSQTEVVKGLTAVTYNLEEGDIVNSEFDSTQTFVEKLTNTWYLKKFALPAVRPGSIIEYKYKVISPFKFNLHDWEFQTEIPTLFSSYQVRLIPFYEYVYILKGPESTIKPDTTYEKKRSVTFNGIDYGEKVYKFSMKDIPAFVKEDNMGAVDDYKIKLDFQLSAVHRTDGSVEKILSTWENLVEELTDNSDFWKYAEASGMYLYDLRKLGLDGMTKEQKARVITQFVTSKFKWNGRYGALASKELGDFYKSKTGNVADINLFLIGLLRAAKIEANPVILSTRGHGKIYKDYPFEHYFNYVVVMASFDETTIFIDATEPDIPYGLLPVRCLNDQGLLAKQGFEKWIPLNNSEVIETEEKFQLKLNSTVDSVIITAAKTVHGYDGFDLRKRLENNPTKLSEHIKNEYIQLFGAPSTNNYDDTSQPYQINYLGWQQVEKIAEKIYISPFPLHLELPGAFASDKRTYLLDLAYPQANSYYSELEIPDGFLVESPPGNFKLSNILYAIEFTVDTSDEHKIIVSGSYTLKQAAYLPEHYLPVKLGLAKAIDLLNQKLVLTARK